MSHQQQIRIGFIGAGTIAEPMVKSLVRRFPKCSVVLSPRSKKISSQLSQRYERVSVAKNNQDVIDRSDYLVLSLLAVVARAELPQLNFRSDQQIVSVMAGYSVETLNVDCFPAQRISMTVPLPFIETGECPLPVYPFDDTVKFLFGNENEILSLDTEAQMLPYLATTGVVATVMHEFNEVAKWLGAQSGNDATAEVFVLKLLGGYLNAMKSDGHQQFQKALQNLSTEGGLNAQLLEHTKQSGHYESLTEGLQALLDRLSASEQ